jgi:hypothetical protein
MLEGTVISPTQVLVYSILRLYDSLIGTLIEHSNLVESHQTGP